MKMTTFDKKFQNTFNINSLEAVHIVTKDR